jgi:hypothetical protein
MRLLFFVGVLLLVVPSVFAIDCSLVDQDSCEWIEEQDLTEEEKEELYNALLYTEFPDYDYVYEYNLDLEVEDSQDKEDGEYIQDAWVAIVAVMPTVEIDDVLYHNGEGEILLTYDYNVEYPSGPDSGDCKTKYGSSSTSRSYKLYANGESIGYSSLQDFEIEEDIELVAELTIKKEIWISHYTEQEKRGKLRCSYDYKEYETETITVSDSLDLVYYDEEPSYSIELTDEANDGYHGSIEIYEYTAFALEFMDSSFEERNWYYYYDINDYGALQIIAEPYTFTSEENLVMDSDYNFVVNDIEDCFLSLYTHFSEEIYSCDLEYEDTDVSISLDKQYYEVGETIVVTVEPSGAEVHLSYNDLELDATDGTEFTAEVSGLVTATFNGKEDTEMVYVQSEDWDTFWSFSWFGIFLYALGEGGMFLGRKIGL